MSLVDRLKIYMEHLQLAVSQFADAAQIPRPTLSQILSGRNKKISNEVLTKLHTAYPSLNIAWLLFGDGPMSLNDAPATDHSQSPAAEHPIPDTPTLKQSEEIPPKPHAAPEASTSDIETPLPIPVKTDSSKRVAYITVFYTNGSYDNFYPQH